MDKDTNLRRQQELLKLAKDFRQLAADSFTEGFKAGVEETVKLLIDTLGAHESESFTKREVIEALELVQVALTNPSEKYPKASA